MTVAMSVVLGVGACLGVHSFLQLNKYYFGGKRGDRRYGLLKIGLGVGAILMTISWLGLFFLGQLLYLIMSLFVGILLGTYWGRLSNLIERFR